jgi:NADPH-dependent 2,4-dienoyl-CoA reductase/sulfur reductase-like enzyme
VARTLEATGKVNYINCSAGSQFAHYGLVIGPGYIPLGFFSPFHSAIRRAVEKIPVFASVRINDPVQAEKILEDGHADLVVMTRAQIADPEISKKAQAGKLDEIRHCIACVQGCIGRGFRLKSITCTQNPRVGREAETTFAPARKQKKVVVVGGGPAGMEAARTAAERGHQVVLFEKEKDLGGQVNIITRIPERGEFNELIRWRRFQLDKLGVKIVLGKEADERVILGESPDAVVLATGSLPTKPEFPGGDLPNVHHLVQVLWENVPLGEHVVIVDTVFKQQAVTLADHLAGMEKKVTLVTPLPYPGMFLGITEIPIMFMRMLTKGVTFMESSEALEFTGDTLIVRNNFTQLTQNIEKIDSLIVIQANRQNDGLFWKLMDKIPEIYRIGDCASPRDVLQAIREGFDVGRKI